MFSSPCCPMLLSGWFGPWGKPISRGSSNLRAQVGSGIFFLIPFQALLKSQVRRRCLTGHRSENRATLGQVPACKKKATEEFGRGTGPANGEEVLGSEVRSDHRTLFHPQRGPGAAASPRRDVAGWDGKEGLLQFLWYDSICKRKKKKHHKLDPSSVTSRGTLSVCFPGLRI